MFRRKQRLYARNSEAYYFIFNSMRAKTLSSARSLILHIIMYLYPTQNHLNLACRQLMAEPEGTFSVTFIPFILERGVDRASPEKCHQMNFPTHNKLVFQNRWHKMEKKTTANTLFLHCWLLMKRFQLIKLIVAINLLTFYHKVINKKLSRFAK